MADQPPVGGIVTGSGKSRRGLLPRVALFTLIALVAAGLVVGAVYYRFKLAMVGSHGPTTATKLENVTPTQALQSAQTELKVADTTAEKATAYDHLGQAYLQNNNAAQAINSYQAAITADKSTEAQAQALGGLAIAYGQAGDLDAEISTLEQLVPLLQKSSDPADQALVPRYQQLISNLQQEKAQRQ